MNSKEIEAVDRHATTFAEGICEKENLKPEFLEPLTEVEKFKVMVSEKNYTVKQTEFYRLMRPPVGCMFLVIKFETKKGKYSNYATVKRSLTNEQKVQTCDELYEHTKKNFKIN